MRVQVYLSLGSNLGNSQEILDSGVASLRSKLENLQVSNRYKTKPLYNLDQPDFINMVVRGSTELEPLALLDFCQSLENQASRERTQWKGPRTLDVDILLYGDLLLSSPRLEIPHPGLEERAFVLIPLLEIAPEVRNPRTNALLKNALKVLEDQGVVPQG